MSGAIKLTLLLTLMFASAVISPDIVYNTAIIQAKAGTQATAAATDTGTIPMDRNRTKADIAAMARQLPHSGFTYDKLTQYDMQPSLMFPYEAGSLKAEELLDSLNAVKMVRYIAGLPYENITLVPALNDRSQHGAALLTATGQFSHSPAQPADMSDAFFNLAYQGCAGANLYKGALNASYAILGFMADPNDTNIAAAAHRRWILKPGAQNFGLGYAERVTSLYVLDESSAYHYEADTYIAWPNAGDFPIEYFTHGVDSDKAPAYPWSVNLGAAYRAPEKEQITLTLTRARDSKTWMFNKDTPQLGEGYMPDDSMHLAVDNLGYGIGKAIVFRPDLTTLGPVLEDDEFTVLISGLETSDGDKAQLTYTIRFFSLQAEMEEQAGREYEKGTLVTAPAVIGAGISAVPCYEDSGTSLVVKMSTVTDSGVVFIAPETARYRVKDNRKSFVDISGHWSMEHIAFASSRELFNGVGESRFDPDVLMSRAMFVTVLSKIYGIDERDYKGVRVFSDVAPNEWYSAGVAWAHENGLADGTGGGKFSPHAPVSRAQMAVLMLRFSDLAGYTLKPVTEQSRFADDSAIEPWCASAVYTLQQAGIVSGKPGRLFDPDGLSTRAEVCALLRQFIEAVLS